MEENPYKAPKWLTASAEPLSLRRYIVRLFVLTTAAVVGGAAGFILAMPLVAMAAMTLTGTYEWDERVRLVQVALMIGCPLVGTVAACAIAEAVSTRKKPPA